MLKKPIDSQAGKPAGSLNGLHAPERAALSRGTRRLAMSALAVGVATIALSFLVGNAQIRAAALPWGISMGVLAGCFFPLALLLLHTSYRRADRESKLAYAALDEREQRLRMQFTELEQVYRISPVGLCFMDTGQRFVRINDSLAALNGLPVEAHIGKRLRDILPDLADIVEPIHRRVIDSGEAVLNFAVNKPELDCPDSSRRYLVSYFPAKCADGSVIGVSTVVKDITEWKQKEEALRDSEQRLRAILDAEPECVKLTDADANLLEMNAAGLSMIDAESSEQAVGISVLSFLVSSHCDAFMDLTRNVFQGRDGELEFEIKSLKGTHRWMASHATPLRDVNGEITAMLSVSRDISEQRLAHLALQESEQRYRLITEAAFDAMVILEDGVFVEVNQAFQRMLGYEASEIIGQRATAFAAAESVSTLMAHIESGSEEQYEIIGIRKDGGRINLEIVSRNTTRRGRPARIAALRDITVQKKAEADLRESLARQKLLVKASNVGLWDWNLKANELFLSPEWKMQLGYADDEIPDTYEEWESRVHPDDVAPTLAAIDEFLAGRRTTEYRIRFRLKHRNNSWRWILAQADLQRDASGEPTRMMGCHIDITELVESEAARETAQLELEDRLKREKEIAQFELEEARAELVLSTRLNTLGRIAAQIAHELRNPLGAIRNAAFYLKGELRDAAPDVREFLGLIEDEVTTCNAIIRNLLEAVRPRQPLRSPLDVTEAVRSAFQRLRVPEEVEFKLHTSHDPFYVDFDPVQFRQCLDNLLSNALDAVEKKGRVDVFLESQDDDALIRIQDSGSGIPADERSHVFEVLYTTKAKGTGLGLAICRQIIEQHGGTIALEQPGTGGASFLIRVPRHA